MSWSFTYSGTKAGVAAKVAAERYLPQGFKDVVSALAAAKNHANGLVVSSNGHIDTACGGYVGKFEASEIFIELDPVEAPATPNPSPIPPAAAAEAPPN